MRISRLLSIAGPTAVLYLLAARASMHVSSPHEWVVGVLSLGLALTPVALALKPPPRAVGRLGALGTVLALAVVSCGVVQPPWPWIHGSMWMLSSLLILELVLPRSMRTSLRHGLLVVVLVGAVAATALGASFVAVSGAVCLIAIGGTGVLHLMRLRRRGYPLEGALCAFGFGVLAAALAAIWSFAVPEALQVGGEFSVGALLWASHLAWIDSHRRALRRSGVAFVAACVAAFVGGALLSERLPDGPWQFGAAAIGLGILWWLTFIAARSLSRRAVWRAASNLAERADATRLGLVGCASLESIAAAVLVPFRPESDDASDVLAIHTLQPPLRIRLDVGDRPMIRSAELPSVYIRAALDAESRVLDFVALRGRVVREPPVRELVDTMERGAVGAILCCRYLDQVEALLLLPIGSRSEPLNMFDIGALSRLADDLGAALTSSLAQRRAQSHIQELSSRRREAEDRISVLEGELEQLRGQQDVLGRRLAEDDSLHVAYSPSMRRVQTRAIELASVSEPVWIVAPSGAAALPVARFIHDRGPRWSSAFVVGDCGAIPSESVAALFFGSERPTRLGWIDSAAGGTLFLRDLPSLEFPILCRIAAWLDTQASDPSSARVIATSRVSLGDLRSRDALPRRLVDCFTGSEISLPALRERREDFPSLVLFATDRACRRLAKPTMGIDQDALDLLATHDWPGDLAELEFVIELAVSRATTTTIGASDLPPLAWPGHADGASLDGTYAQVEKRLLIRALERACGNKSEAARLLGLKRTTFLDKLRRHQLERREVG